MFDIDINDPASNYNNGRLEMLICWLCLVARCYCTVRQS